jgi:hypothetical protein
MPVPSPPPLTPPVRDAGPWPIALLVLAAWGLLSSWDANLLGWRVGAPLTRWLQASLGDEGVRPGRDLLGRFFFMIALGLVVWLVARRHAGPPLDRRAREQIRDTKAAVTTLLLCIASAAATLVFLARNLFGGPGSWPDDNLGPPSLDLSGVALLAGVTLLLAMVLRYLHQRLRRPARSEPRTPDPRRVGMPPATRR